MTSLGALGARDLDQPDLVLELLGRFLLDLPGQRRRHSAGRTRSGVEDSVEALTKRGVGPETRGYNVVKCAWEDCDLLNLASLI